MATEGARAGQGQAQQVPPPFDGLVKVDIVATDIAIPVLIDAGSVPAGVLSNLVKCLPASNSAASLTVIKEATAVHVPGWLQIAVAFTWRTKSSAPKLSVPFGLDDVIKALKSLGIDPDAALDAFVPIVQQRTTLSAARGFLVAGLNALEYGARHVLTTLGYEGLPDAALLPADHPRWVKPLATPPPPPRTAPSAALDRLNLAAEVSAGEEQSLGDRVPLPGVRGPSSRRSQGPAGVYTRPLIDMTVDTASQPRSSCPHEREKAIQRQLILGATLQAEEMCGLLLFVREFLVDSGFKNVAASAGLKKAGPHATSSAAALNSEDTFKATIDAVIEDVRLGFTPTPEPQAKVAALFDFMRFIERCRNPLRKPWGWTAQIIVHRLRRLLQTGDFAGLSVDISTTEAGIIEMRYQNVASTWTAPERAGGSMSA
ncbi:MAG: hypothetical protein ACO3JL_15510 [Myxococcota bacterium]